MRRQPPNVQATTRAAVTRACTTIQQTVQIALASGLLELSDSAFKQMHGALRVLTAPTGNGGATLAAQIDAATATALVQLNSCLLRAVQQHVSSMDSEPHPGPSSSAAQGPLTTLLLWHRSQRSVAGFIEVFLQARPAHDSSPTQAAAPRCMRRRIVVALLRSDTLQGYCMVMAALLEKALGPDASDPSTGDPKALGRVRTLALCLVDCTVDALGLARRMCNVTKRDARVPACLHRALHTSGLLAHACHALLRLADWRQASCRLPDYQPIGQHELIDCVLCDGIWEARTLMCEVLSRPELARLVVAALAPAVQYFVAAQLVEAAAAMDGGPTHGLRTPGVMRLLEARFRAEGCASQLDSYLKANGLMAVTMLPAASILGHPLYLRCRRQRQHMLLGEQAADSGAEAAPDQRGNGANLPPALFGPTQSFDLLVRGVDCIFREVEAAGQQAAAGSGAPAARGGPSPEERHDAWQAMAGMDENTHSALAAAAVALDAMAPRQREQRLPRMWCTLSRAMEGAASAGWSNTVGFALLQLAAGRLKAAATASIAPPASHSSPSHDAVNHTVNPVNTVNGELRGVNSEARVAHQQGYVCAWAAALRWIRRTATDPTNICVAWPLIRKGAIEVPACWSALHEAGALPSELAQVAVALRKLVAAEATVLPGVNLWFEVAVTLLMQQHLAVRELGAVGVLPPMGEQPSSGAESVPGAALGPGRGSGSGGSCNPGAAQEQKVVDRAALGACAALALLPTLSRWLAALLRQQVQPGLEGRLGARVSPSVVSCMCSATGMVMAWAQQVVMDGVCGVEPVAPAAAAGNDTAAEAYQGRGLMQPQAPQPSPSGSSTPRPRPEQAAAGAGAATSALHPACGGVTDWRRFATHGLALGELAAAGLDWAAAVSAPPGEGPLGKETLDEFGPEADRAAAAKEVAEYSCTILMLLEVMDRGWLNRTLVHVSSTAAAGSGAAPAGSAAVAASLDALARSKRPSVCDLLDMVNLLRTLGGSVLGPELLQILTWGGQSETWTYSRWLPPLDVVAALLPAACSNPLCASPEGPCEAQGQGPQGQALRACGRCGGARYCSRDCQVAHWRAGHKAECEEAQAAAAAANAAAAAAAMPPRAAAGPRVERPC